MTTYGLLQRENWLNFVWIHYISILSCYVLVSNEQVISPSKSVTSERNVSRLLDDLDSQVLPPPRSVMTHPPAFPLAFYKLHLIFVLYYVNSEEPAVNHYEQVSIPNSSFAHGVTTQQRPAATATRDLDNLMASLSEFKVRLTLTAVVIAP